MSFKTMQEKSNAVGVVCKMKLVLNGHIKTGDKIIVSTSENAKNFKNIPRKTRTKHRCNIQ